MNLNEVLMKPFLGLDLRAKCSSDCFLENRWTDLLLLKGSSGSTVNGLGYRLEGKGFKLPNKLGRISLCCNIQYMQ